MNEKIKFENKDLLLFIFIITAFIALILCAFRIPSVDDEMFYLDAAWNLQNGTYVAPSLSSPYHHYIRWAVVFPAAILIKLFGSSFFVYNIIAIFPYVISSVIIYQIFDIFFKEVLFKISIAITPIVLAFIFNEPRVLSEGHSIMWLLISVLSLFYIKNSWRYLVGGFLYSFAVNCNLVNIFYLLTPLIFITIFEKNLYMTYSWRNLAQKVFTYTLGFMLGLLFILYIDFIMTGDPLLQYKIIKIWHFNSLEDMNLSKYLFDLKSNMFLFGFIIGIIKKNSILTALIIFWSIVNFKLMRPEVIKKDITLITIFAWAFFVAGLHGLLLIELFGSFVIDKYYLRFISIPITFLTLSVMIRILEFAKDSQRLKDISLSCISLFLLGFLIIFSTSKLAIKKQIQCGMPYFEEIKAISSDSKSDPVIIISQASIPGLVPYSIALRVFSNFRFSGKYIEVDNEGLFEKSKLQIEGSYAIFRNDSVEKVPVINYRRIRYFDYCNINLPTIFKYTQK
jgi:hypothetical protein